MDGGTFDSLTREWGGTTSRRNAIKALLAGAAGLLGFKAFSGAEASRATLIVHNATCPSLRSGDAFYTDCHNRGFGCTTFTAQGRSFRTNRSGVASIRVSPGTFTLRQGSLRRRTSGTWIFCSDEISGRVLYENGVSGNSVSLKVLNGERVVCDWYNITTNNLANPNNCPMTPTPSRTATRTKTNTPTATPTCVPVFGSCSSDAQCCTGSCNCEENDGTVNPNNCICYGYETHTATPTATSTPTDTPTPTATATCVPDLVSCTADSQCCNSTCSCQVVGGTVTPNCICFAPTATPSNTPTDTPTPTTTTTPAPTDTPNPSATPTCQPNYSSCGDTNDCCSGACFCLPGGLTPPTCYCVETTPTSTPTNTATPTETATPTNTATPTATCVPTRDFCSATSQCCSGACYCTNTSSGRVCQCLRSGGPNSVAI